MVCYMPCGPFAVATTHSGLINGANTGTRVHAELDAIAFVGGVANGTAAVESVVATIGEAAGSRPAEVRPLTICCSILALFPRF